MEHIRRDRRWVAGLGGLAEFGQAMRLHSAYFISVLGAASAALCFAVTLALPTTMVAPKPDAGFSDQAPNTNVTNTVNRASKGDRLRVIIRPPGAEPFDVQVPRDTRPKPLEGCEPAFGRMDHSPAAGLAQDCIT
jgi:hypothetical protein